MRKKTYYVPSDFRWTYARRLALSLCERAKFFYGDWYRNPRGRAWVRRKLEQSEKDEETRKMARDMICGWHGDLREED